MAECELDFWIEIDENYSKLFLGWSMMSYGEFDMKNKPFYWLNHEFYRLFPENIQKLSIMIKNEIKLSKVGN